MTMSDISSPVASADPRLRRDMSVSRMRAAWAGIRAGLRGRRGLFLAGVVASIGILAGWVWFGIAAILPLLYMLPCVAMMAMCMKGLGASTENPSRPIPLPVSPNERDRRM